MARAARKILIVDDDPVIAAIYRKRFEANGFEVRWALDTAAAASTLPAFQPHILLLDLNMPGENGLDFLAKLRSVPRYRDLPVVIVTGEPRDSPKLQEAARSPVTGVMRKDEWDADAIFTAVEWALQQPQRQAAKEKRETDFWPVQSR